MCNCFDIIIIIVLALWSKSCFIELYQEQFWFNIQALENIICSKFFIGIMLYFYEDK